MVHDVAEWGTGVANQVLANAIKDHDGVVHREADDGQHGGHKEGIDLNACNGTGDRKEADRHDDVMEECHEGCHAEPQIAEAIGHPEQNSDRSKHNEEERLLRQVLADDGADGRDRPLFRDRSDRGNHRHANRFELGASIIDLVLANLEIEWLCAHDQEAGTSLGHRCLFVASAGDRRLHHEWIGWALWAELPDRAARVVDGELQANGAARDWGRQGEDQPRNRNEQREEEEPTLTRNDLIHARPPDRVRRDRPSLRRRGTARRSAYVRSRRARSAASRLRR